MSDTPANTLRKLRTMLVDERRSAANEAIRLKDFNQHSLSQALNHLVSCQAQIEVIDRAVKDEEALQPPAIETWSRLAE